MESTTPGEKNLKQKVPQSISSIIFIIVFIYILATSICNNHEESEKNEKEFSTYSKRIKLNGFVTFNAQTVEFRITNNDVFDWEIYVPELLLYDSYSYYWFTYSVKIHSGETATIPAYLFYNGTRYFNPYSRYSDHPKKLVIYCNTPKGEGELIVHF